MQGACFVRDSKICRVLIASGNWLREIICGPFGETKTENLARFLLLQLVLAFGSAPCKYVGGFLCAAVGLATKCSRMRSRARARMQSSGLRVKAGGWLSGCVCSLEAGPLTFDGERNQRPQAPGAPTPAPAGLWFQFTSQGSGPFQLSHTTAAEHGGPTGTLLSGYSLGPLPQ